MQYFFCQYFRISPTRWDLVGQMGLSPLTDCRRGTSGGTSDGDRTQEGGD